jgi:hypothetical protein
MPISTRFLLIPLFFLWAFSAFSQANVTITPASTVGGVPICVGGPAINLTNIVIAETNTGGGADDDAIGGIGAYWNDITLVLGVPADFQFVAGVGNVSAIPGNDDVVIGSYTIAANSISITFDAINNDVDRFDAIIISGLQIRAVSGPAQTLNITRTGGTSVITGLAAGGIVGSVTSALPPASVISGDNSVCASEQNVVYSTPLNAGNTYSWTVTGGIIDGSSTNNTVTVDWGTGVAGTVRVTETRTATGCSTTTAAYPVTINPNPTPSISGDNSVCAGEQNVVYTTASVGGHTYSWSVTGGTIDGSSTGNSVTIDWGVAGPGTLQVTETITATTCAVTTSLYNVTINPNPAPSIGGLATVCANQTGVSYTTANVGGDTYAWSVTGGSITAGAGTNTITVTWGAAGAGTVQVTQTTTATGCVTTTAAYPVTIQPNPTPSISGDNSVCAAEQNVVYTTANVGGHTYSWSVTGGSFDGPSTGNSVTIDWGVAGPGTLQVTETITATTCAVTTSLYNVTINPNPAPSIGGLATVCANQTGVSYTTANVGGDTYAWSVTGGSITAGAGTNTITVTWGAAGAGTVQVTQTTTATGCATTTAAYPVTINANPTPSITGLNAVCSNQAGVVYSTTAAGGRTYAWTVTGGAITGGAGTNSITVTWGAAGAGTVQLQETIVATTCSVTTPLYNVTINPNPTPSIGGLATVCANQTGVSYTTANVVGDTYAWSVTGGSITAGAGTNVITVTWGAAGAGTIQVTQTTTATGCATTTAAYPVTINPNPTPSISGDNSVCAGEQNVVYTTASVGGHTYSWFVTGGSFDGPSTGNSVTIDWGVAGPGTLQVTETITATTCAVTTSLYNVTINPNPAPSIGGLATVCANQTGVSYTTANVGGDTYAWSVTGGSITAGAGTNTITVTWGAAGAGTVQVTQTTTATGCATTTAAYPVTINPNPTPSISGDNSVCAGEQNVVYSILAIGGHTYSWSVTGGVIDGSSTGNSVVIDWGVAGAGTVQVTETITASGCSTVTPLYNITINPTPTPSIVGVNSVCANTQNVGYSTAVVAGRTYSWSVTGGTIDGPTTNSSVIVDWGVSGTGTIVLVETISATGCATTTPTFNVTINANPAPSIAGPVSACENQTGLVYTSANVVGDSYAWSVGGGSIASGAGTNSITVDWGAAGAGTVQLTQTTLATGCVTTTPVYNVTINPNPAPSISGPNTVCASQQNVDYSTPLVAGRTYLWVVTGGTIDGAATSNTVRIDWGVAGVGTLRVTETITATGCAIQTPVYNVTKEVNPTPSISGPTSACVNQAGLIYSTTNVVGNTYFWTVSGGASITAGQGTNQITVTWGTAGARTVSVTETITATGCAITTPNYNVTVNPNPTPNISGINFVCAGDDVIYSTPSAAGRTYSWSVTGGTITAGAGTFFITVDWGAAGAGTIQLTETINATGCAVTTPLYNVTINPNPTPSISGLTTVCENASGVNYSTPNIGGHTYSWNVTGGTITSGAGTNSINVDWGSAGIGTIVLTETISATGCPITTPAYNVTINPNPTPVISGSNTACSNQSGVIYSTPAAGGRTYNWTVTGGTIAAGAGTASIQVNWGAAGAGLVQLTEIIDATGCSTAATNFNVTINAAPTPVVSGLSTVCANQNGVAYSSPNVIGNVYIWSLVGGSIASGEGTNSITVNWASAGAGTVTLSEFAPSTGCFTTSTPLGVTINPNPTPGITGDNTVCAAEQDVAYSTPAVAGHTYSWTISGGVIDGSSTGNSIVVDWGGAGVGTLQLTEIITLTGCAVTTPLYNVTINNSPTPIVSGLNTVCANTTGVTYSTPNVIGDLYSWSVVGGTIVSGSATNSIVVDWGAAGAGSVTVTEFIVASNCAVTTVPYVVTINPIPTPSITGNNTVCANAQDKVYSTPLVAGHTYSWTVTGGTIDGSSTGNSILVDWGTAGTGSVQLTETITATSCVITTPVYSININDIPTPVISGLTAVCANEAGVVYSTPNAPGNSYTWVVTGGSVVAGAGTSSITVNWGAAGTGSITLTELVPASACVTVTAPYNVTINPIPSPVVSGDNTVCENDQNVIYSSPLVGGNTYLWVVTGGTIDGPANGNSVAVDWGTAGAGTVTLTEQVGACSITTPAYGVTISPNPTPVISGSNSVCRNQTGVVYSTPPAGGRSYSWAVVGGTIDLGSGTNSISVTWTGAGTGSVTLTETILATGCNITTAPFLVTVSPNPTVSAGSDEEICTSATFNFATQGTPAAAIDYASLLWTTTGTGTLSNAATLTPSYTPGGGESGPVTFTLTADGIGACADVIDQMLLNVTPLPVVNAGSDSEVCANTLFNFTSQVTPSSASNYSSISWTHTGAGTLFNPTTLTPTYLPAIGETGVIVFTIQANSTGSCASVTDAMNLTITPAPTVSAGGDAEICQGLPFNFATQAPLAAATNYLTIAWTSSGTGVLTNANTLTPTYTPGVGEAGNVIFTLTATGNGSCVPIQDIMILTITPSPVVNAGSDEEICENATFNFTAQAALASASNYSSITWTTTGTGTLFNANTLTPTYFPLVGETGNVTFTLTATGNGSCVNVNDQMVLAITPSPTVTAGSDSESCQGITFNFSSQVTPASAANYASLLWTHTGAGTIFNANTVAPTYVPGVGETGSITFTLTANGNGSCVSVLDQMILTITPSPTVSAGSDAETCQGVGYNFATQGTPASATNFASIAWTTTGTGILSNANTLTPSYAPGIGEAGNVTFTLTATGNGSCVSVIDQMVLVITPSATVTAGSNEETCQGVTFNFSTQSALANATNYASILWTTTGTGILTNANTLTPSYAPGAGETGNINFTLTATGNGSCVSVNDQMTLVITPSPTVSAGSDAETCQGISYNFTTQGTPSTATNNASVLWTHSGAGTIFNANTLIPTYTPGVGETGNVTFTLTAFGNGSCTSVIDQMILTITPSPTIAAGSDAETCQGVNFNFSTRGTLASGANYASLLWTHTGTGIISNANTLSPNYTPGVGETGIVTFTLTAYGNGSCLSVNDQMVLTITPAPTVAAGSDAETCQGVNYNFSAQGTPATATNFASILWTHSGTGTIFNANTLIPSYQPGVGEAGNVTFMLTATGNGSCVSVNDQMILVITPSPVVTAGSDEETCEGVSFNFGTQGTLANATNNSSVLWTTTGTGILTNANTLTPTYAPGAGETGNVTFTLTALGNGSCASVNDQMILTITPSPIVSAGSDSETCQGVIFNFNTQVTLASVSNFSSILWSTTGTGLLSNANTLTPIYSPGVGETGNVTFTLTASGNGSCVSVNDQMTLVITPSPSVSAGSDAETCEGVSYNFSTQLTPANATNNASVLWTTTGTGILTNANTLTPSYTPGVGETGSVTFTLTATGNGSCVSVNDQMTLTITPSPTVTAGSDEETCQGINYNFGTQGTPSNATNYLSILWTTTGTGTLFNANAIAPTYQPGVGEAGNVTFTMTVTGNGSCTSINDQMTLAITPKPIMSAGSDAETCEGIDYNFNTQSTLASASNFSGLLWTHTGTGSLAGATTLTPIYTPGVGETGAVTFTLTASGNGSCVAVMDAMVLTITPAVTINAGSDEEICQGGIFSFASQATVASASNYNSLVWTHDGSGALFNANTLTPTYFAFPSETGVVTFTLLAVGNGSCVSLNDAIALTITPAPVAIAGSDDAVCEGTPTFDFATRFTAATNLNGSVLWSHNGTGSLNDNTLINPIYTVGAGDVNNTVTFTLTVTSPSAVCTTVQDQFELDVNEAALVSVPLPSITVCEPNQITLSGSFGGSATSAAWSKAFPTGSLSTSSITGLNVTALYDTIAADVSNTLIFTLTTNDPDGGGPCTTAFVDLAVTIDESAKVFAGNDFAVCEYEDIDLNGSFSGATSSITWSGGSGAPQFGNVASPITSYDMTPAERAATNLTLTFTITSDDPVGVCSAVSDQVNVTVYDTLSIVSIIGLSSVFAENDPPVVLTGLGFPAGGIFSGTGVSSGTFFPSIANITPAPPNIITYTYTDPATGCNSAPQQQVIVNPITAVSFLVESERTDGVGDPHVCANQGDVKLIELPDVDIPNLVLPENAIFTSTGNGGLQLPLGAIYFDGVDYRLKTNGLTPGKYEITYNYTNSLGATNPYLRLVWIDAAPRAIIDVGNSCETAAITFTESSDIPVNPFGATITEWLWNFGDGNGSATQEPTYQYLVSGNKTVTLRVTTNEFCTRDTVKSVRIGPVPDMDFSWSAFCNGNDTEFKDLTDAGISTIVKYTWQFGDPYGVANDYPVPVEPVTDNVTAAKNNGGRTGGTYKDPHHRYDLPGSYTVTLTVETNDGCINSLPKQAFILSYGTPSPTAGYFEDFEATEGNWFGVRSDTLASVNDVSWIWGPPVGSVITPSLITGTNSWWTGGNAGSFYSNEISTAIGPCINLTNIKRPMVSFDYWADSENNRDGAVLQYSTDGGITWLTIGDDGGAGINWYNGRAIIGNPGMQSIGQFGWTGRDTGWKTARFNLDQIDKLERTEVIFRIAFGSDGSNAPATLTPNGFAFDNIFIGEKKRNILVEYFTNAGISATANDYLNNLYDEQFTLLSKDSSDFFKIQYHIANPSLDNINQDNPVDPAARSLFYGVSQPPVGIMDGILGDYFGTDFNGDQTKIDAVEVDRRALEDPLFDILVTELVTTNDSIKLDVQFEYIDAVIPPTLTSPVTFHVGLVESNVSGNINVLRKLLLGSEGTTVNIPWSFGTTTAVPVKSIIDVPIGMANNNLWIVAFVQDRNTKRIHQTALVKLSQKDQTTIVGVEEDPELTRARDIQIFPNPASRHLNFTSEYRLMSGYTYSIVDQRGITMLNGELQEDIFSPQQVELDNLANGVYFVVISRGGRALVHRKIAVMNRN